MWLIRDVLDKQVLARDRVKIGKVDGIVVELEDNAAPRVAFIEMGAVALARRLGRWPGATASATAQLLGGNQSKGPHRIPWDHVRNIGLNIEVDVAARPFFAWQRWLRDHIIGRIPGA
jgi:sporulation protein YlmC with PRC-barrel domain